MLVNALPPSGRWRWLAVAVLLVCFGISVAFLQADSLTPAEAKTAWAIYYNPTEQTGQLASIQSPRGVLGFLRDDTVSALRNLRDARLSPLYIMLLNTWSLIMGESELALRVVSALWGMVALASVFAWGRVYRVEWLGVLVAALVGTSAPFLNASRQATDTMQFLALTLLMTLMIERFAQRPSWKRGVLLLFMTALALLTNPIALIVLVVQVGLLVLRRVNRHPLFERLAPFVLVIALGVVLGRNLSSEPNVAWRDLVANAAATRSSEEPALIAFSDDSPLAYYNRLTPLVKGISLDIGWRDFTQAEITALVATLENNLSIWLIAPETAPVTEWALAALTEAGFETVTYEERSGGVVVMRRSKQ
jgi:hypothetical protein